MRLINADELKKWIIGYEEGQGYINEKDIPKIPTVDAIPLSVIEDIKAEIEQVKVIMNEEIIDNSRKDLINFVNGLNQCLIIIDKHTSGKEHMEVSDADSD